MTSQFMIVIVVIIIAIVLVVVIVREYCCYPPVLSCFCYNLREAERTASPEGFSARWASQGFGSSEEPGLAFLGGQPPRTGCF